MHDETQMSLFVYRADIRGGCTVTFQSERAVGYTNLQIPLDFHYVPRPRGAREITE